MYLITGATGFIGSKLVKALNLEQEPTLILARKKIPGFETVICDLETDLIPNDIFSEVDTIIHLAGYAHDKRNSKSHLNKLLNFDVTVRLAKKASVSGVRKFVFISSVKASGAPFLEKCMTESDQAEPEDEYGSSKRKSELELIKISQKSKMKISIVRPALVYGPNVKGNLNEMMFAIKKGFFPPIPNVKNRRSMVHVDDLVRAIILISRDVRANGKIFNVTDGKPYSSREIYLEMCTLLGKQAPNWKVPLFLFKVLSVITFGKLFEIEKLFGSEYYSSEELNKLGYKAERSLGEMNETIF